MSDLRVVGSNAKVYIDDDTSFVDGDLLLCEPGVDMCSSRLFFMRDNKLEYATGGSMFEQAFNLDGIPTWSDEKFAFSFRAGLDYHVFDLIDFAFQEEYTLTHISDQERERYFEAWVTFFPTSLYSPTVYFSDTVNLLRTNDTVFLRPNLYPDVIQSITLPAAASAEHNVFASSAWTYIYVADSGNQFITWAETYAVIYEWNDANTEYDEKYVWTFADCSNIYSACISQDNTIAAIMFWDDVLLKQRVVKLENNAGIWIAIETVDNPSTSIGQMYIYDTGTTKFLHTGAATSTAACYYWDDFSFLNSAASVEEDWTIFSGYTLFNFDLHYPAAYGNILYCFLGICKDAVGYKYYRGGTAGVNRIEYPFHSDDFNEYAVYGPLNYYHNKAGDTQWVLGTDDQQLWQYEFLWWQEDLPLPTEDPRYAYIWDRYLVGYGSNGVYYSHDQYEPILIESFDFATHMIYNGPFFPVKNPYYLCNNNDGTLKVMKIGEHFDESSPGTAILKFTTPADIVTITQWSTDAPAGTLFLFSWDKTTWYKYTTGWVVESDPANGMTEAVFNTGAQAGFSAPAETRVAYVKAYLNTTDPDAPQTLTYSATKLGLTILSLATNSYLCDDSQIEVEYISDTETKITSKISQNVILSCQMTFLAPPYNERYEDNG